MKSVLLAAVFLLTALAFSAPVASADVPNGKPLYNDGPGGRVLLDGEWLFRLDGPGDGIANGFQRSTSREGWAPVTVPNAWNAGDDSDASMAGDVGWYRKDFELPSADADLDWIVRFESVNYRSRVWLNGRPIGSHTGAYLPFEFRLLGLKRRGTNRLVIRVDSRRRATDFPPAGLNAVGRPTGGWWNYGGLIREVYLRKVDTVDFGRVFAKPNVTCASCPASVDLSATVRNMKPSTQRVALRGRFGSTRVDFGSATVAGRGTHTFKRRVRVSNPILWSPSRPYLYAVGLAASVAQTRSSGAGSTTRSRTRLRKVANYSFKTGLRSVRISGDGRLQLNGRPTNFRGVGLHEDARAKGFALDNAERDKLIALTRELGATLMRSHYPFHPYIHEQADKLGILIWSEIPVYSNRTEVLKQERVRKLAVRELEENVIANGNHPSIVVWSIANELSSRPGATQGLYIRAAATRANELDGTRPIGMALSGYPNAGCHSEYAPIDVLGINEYFGWYPGPGGAIFDRTRLSSYLDTVRGCYPEKAIVVSEFGAEANRDGPIEEKGTWLFQQDFVNYHLGVHASKPWLSGSIYWALREFRVRPGWDGGNPRPSPPVHQKGLVSYDGVRKPAFYDVQRLFTGTRQFGR